LLIDEVLHLSRRALSHLSLQPALRFLSLMIIEFCVSKCSISTTEICSSMIIIICSNDLPLGTHGRKNIDRRTESKLGLPVLSFLYVETFSSML
jgi:hypothetical protein